jgi:predicted nucleic acid-binding protein
MAFIVIYDANVLYPNTLRDLLIRIAQQPHLEQAKWIDQIIDETLRALQKNRPDITEEKAARLRELINGAVRDCLVTGYQSLIEVLDLPDPDDRHVLAAAIKVNAQLIVTKNLKDFPPKTLAQWDIRPKSPDNFVRVVCGRVAKRPRCAARQLTFSSWSARTSATRWGALTACHRVCADSMTSAGER